MQRLILTSVVGLFLFTWGMVIYQIFIKEELVSKYGDEASLISVDKNKNLLESNIEIIRKNEREIVRTVTEKNNLSDPPLERGIDFGEGISIDDLLESHGIVMNSN